MTSQSFVVVAFSLLVCSMLSATRKHKNKCTSSQFDGKKNLCISFSKCPARTHLLDVHLFFFFLSCNDISTLENVKSGVCVVSMEKRKCEYGLSKCMANMKA